MVGSAATRRVRSLVKRSTPGSRSRIDRSPAIPELPRREFGLRAGASTRSSKPKTGDTGAMADRNVLGEQLEPCGTDPLTGFYRDGSCATAAEDLGMHTICAVVTAE